jgi:ribonuclease HI
MPAPLMPAGLAGAGAAVQPTLRLVAFGGGVVAPSNNRAELLGVVAGLGAALALLDAGASVADVELVSDSLITVRTLREWLPARRRAGTEGELANGDLIAVADRLLAAVRGRARVELTHVAGHAARPPASAPARAHLFWAGNDAADRAATGAITAPGFGCGWVDEKTGPPAPTPADIQQADVVRAWHVLG